MTSYGMSLSRVRAEFMSSDGVGMGTLSLGKFGPDISPVLFQRALRVLSQHDSVSSVYVDKIGRV
jgi:hypothetical protein